MSRLALLGSTDVGWVSDAIDIVESGAGRPWRDALERLDDLQRAVHGNAPRRFRAVVGALQRITGGRAKNAAAARRARSLVLGRPALTDTERHTRVSTAAEQLAIAPTALEKLLWSDLPRERPVELPYGRPLELEVAAFANVGILQRAFRRAQAVTLRMTDDPGPILRACARSGLLATANILETRHDANARVRIATEIVIVGPLALFHRTSVYGRALAELVPLLGELCEYEIEIHAETSAGVYTMVAHATRGAPILLPSPPARLSAVPYPVARLARALQQAERGIRGQDRERGRLAITCVPPPILAGTSILCPDLLVECAAGSFYVEILGFWTAEHVRRKRAAYRAGKLDVILCLDATKADSDVLDPGARGTEPTGASELMGACADDAVVSDVLMFRRHPDAEEVLARVEQRWSTLCM